jgi:hypothetical protein
MVKSAAISTATVIADASSVVFVWSLSGRMILIGNLIKHSTSRDSDSRRTAPSLRRGVSILSLHGSGEAKLKR